MRRRICHTCAGVAYPGAMDADEIRRFDGPENRCFGCSPHNPRGLRMRFTSAGAGVVESRYVADPELCGAEGVVHGGVQAALLDEAMGMAIHAGLGPEGDGPIVTVELRVHYRRPAPTGVALVVRGTFLRREGSNVYVEGRILDAAGKVCTEAHARWKRVERRAAASG